ncbi:TPA: acyltransferase [Streptococcus suis]
MSNTRDTKIDNLRVIGILLVILAHSGSGKLINDFRSFDVILLVFLSAICVTKEGYSSYLEFKSVALKRIRRIILPTYLFVVAFGILSFIAYRVAGKPELFGLRQIVNSFLLCEDSVGYIWIMKVYFINALITPMLLRVLSKIKNWQYSVLIAVEILTYAIIRTLYIAFLDGNYVAWIVIDQWIICCLAYLFVAQEAIWYKNARNVRNYVPVIWLLVFLVTCLISETGFSPAAGKRPPNLQYIAYGLAMSGLLYRYIPQKTNAFFEWISKNSLTIYLVHPIFILLFNTIKNIRFLSAFSITPIKYIVTVCGSILIVFLYQHISCYKGKEGKTCRKHH